MSTLTVSLKILKVVNSTNNEKTNVQMGSMMTKLGLEKMMRAAMKTPKLWRKSPTTWMKAALTLMFSES